MSLLAEPEAEQANFSDLLSGQARANPDNVAIDEAGVRTTFGELDADVNRLANWLISQLGLGDHRIGLRITGARALVVAALGCARAGKITVPVDPGYPTLRLDQVLRDTSASLVLTDDEGSPPSEYCDFVVLDRCLAEGAATPVSGMAGGQDACAIGYTSGSTGVPKGVVASHETRRLIAQVFIDTGCVPGSRMGMFCVGSLPQAEATLPAVFLGGGTLVPFDIRKNDFGDLAAWIKRERITVLSAVPTVFRHLARALPQERAFPDLMRVALFGESLLWSDVEAARTLIGEGAIVANAYGSSEGGMVTLNAIGPEVPIGEGRVSTGRPMAGYEVLILDEAGDVREDGPGEIGIIGPGVPLGYWGRPDLDATVYVTRPDGSRLCRTGDVGQFLPDGTLDHIGRLDHVVKIQGNRVDLGEVETVIALLPQVAAVAVAAKTDPSNDLRLVAYVVPREGDELDHLAVRRHLSRRLPGFMLPDQLVLLTELPRLPNGKVDRAALPDRPTTRPDTGLPAESASDSTEQTIAAIFSEFLGLDEVGVHDDFFELGGDSLRAAQLLAEIETVLHVDLPISVMVHSSTVASLASVVRSDGGDERSTLIPIHVHGSKVPLYMLPNGSGSVLYGRELAQHLSHEQPVYGLHALSTHDQVESFGTVAAAARTYIDAIRKLRPHGPYALFGHSLGGIIAYEMAGQLEAEGETVSFLGLGDTQAPWDRPPVRLLSKEGFLQARHRLLEAKKLKPRAALKHLALIAYEKVRRTLLWRRNGLTVALRKALPEPKRALSLTHHFDDVILMLSEDCVHWQPKPVSVSPILFRAEDFKGQRDAGWTSVSPELQVVSVSGDHLSMLTPPHSAVLAEAIESRLSG